MVHLKMSRWKREHIDPNHQFWGSTLIFGGVYIIHKNCKVIHLHTYMIIYTWIHIYIYMGTKNLISTLKLNCAINLTKKPLVLLASHAQAELLVNAWHQAVLGMAVSPSCRS